MAVITISRESGARGNYIGHKLAEELGYTYIDQTIIHEVSLDYGVGQDEFEHIYEQAPGLLERYAHRNREIVELFGRIIRGIAQRDNVVIVGRGSFVVLREFADVLNVRVTANQGVRVQRIQQDQDITLKQAQKLLDRLDNERGKFIEAYYGLNWADAALYELCVNTGKLTPDQAVELIRQTLSLLEKNRNSEDTLVRNLETDPILEKAINDALNLLEATGQMP